MMPGFLTMLLRPVMGHGAHGKDKREASENKGLDRAHEEL
jgi:hypothetical protein